MSRKRHRPEEIVAKLPHGRWHLDEMFVRVGGQQIYLWRAVDAEGEVLDVLLQAKRDRRAAQKLMRKLLKRQGMAPDEWVTDKNPAYELPFAR